MQQRNLRPLKVLYVEDEVLIALDTEGILRQLGLTNIVVALSFEDASRAIVGNRFDLALLDINLGAGKTSLPIAESLARSGTKILFLSGYNPTPELKARLKAPLIEKPFDEATVRAAIMSLLEEGR